MQEGECFFSIWFSNSSVFQFLFCMIYYPTHAYHTTPFIAAMEIFQCENYQTVAYYSNTVCCYAPATDLEYSKYNIIHLDPCVQHCSISHQLYSDPQQCPQFDRSVTSCAPQHVMTLHHLQSLTCTHVHMHTQKVMLLKSLDNNYISVKLLQSV